MKYCIFLQYLIKKCSENTINIVISWTKAFSHKNFEKIIELKMRENCFTKQFITKLVSVVFTS